MLDTAALLRNAPSIFTEEPYFDTSSKYRMVRTYDVVNALKDMNYSPIVAKQSRTRVPGKAPYTRHMVVFRHKDAEVKAKDMGLGYCPDVLLSNSHDGLSSYQIDLAIFRFICSNGLVVKQNDFGTFRVKHTGNVVDSVVESLGYIETAVPRIMAGIEDWSNVELSSTEELLFADNILKTRYDKNAPILPQALTVSRRYGDEKRDLWTIFNKFQENIMRGGLSSGLRGAQRRRTTRPIRGVSETIRFNREAWSVAEQQYSLLINRLKDQEAVEAI